MKIGIVTDSTCDLPSQTLEKYPVICISTEVIVGGKVYIDWQDILPVALYQMMLTDSATSFDTTPGPIDNYVDSYRQALETYDHVIGIHISAKVSKVFEQARTAVAALNAQERTTLIDVNYINSGLAEPVLAASRMIQEGITEVESIVNEVYRIRDNMLYIFSPQSLKWLVEHGRVPNIAAAFANALNMRPLLTIEAGVAKRYGRARPNNILARLVEEIEKEFGNTPINLTFSTAGMAPTQIAEFKRFIAESSLHVNQARLQMIGATLGVTLGPGTVGVAAYPAKGEIFDID